MKVMRVDEGLDEFKSCKLCTCDPSVDIRFYDRCALCTDSV